MNKKTIESVPNDVTRGSPPVQAVWSAGHSDGEVGGGPTITPHALWQSELQDKPD